MSWILDQKYDTLEYKSSWKNEKKVDYQNAFSIEKIQRLSDKIANQSSAVLSTQEKIDQLTADLTDIIIEPAKKVGFCKKVRKKITKKPRVNPRKSWFNEACETSRSNYFKAINAIWEKTKLVQK